MTEAARSAIGRSNAFSDRPKQRVQP